MKDNIAIIRTYCESEIVRRTGKPFSADTIADLKDDLDFRLHAFEQTPEGKQFKVTDYGKANASELYHFYKTTLLQNPGLLYSKP